MESKHGPQGMFDNRIPSSIYGISFPPDGWSSTGSVAKSIISFKHSTHLLFCSPLSLTVLHLHPHPDPGLWNSFCFPVVIRDSTAESQTRFQQKRTAQATSGDKSSARRHQEVSHHAPRTVTRPRTGNFVKKFSNANIHVKVCTLSRAIG